MNNCDKLTTNKWLGRSYYESDPSFYTNGIIISCLDLIRREALREYNVDEYLVFCEDINVIFSSQPDDIYFTMNHLDYKSEVCRYYNVTNNSGEAVNCIQQLLDDGKLVVFQTAMDYLKPNVWYHPNPPYIKTQHWSTLLGYDQQHYFLLEEPRVRSSQHFKAHPSNPSVGLLDKEELHQAFEIYCNVGYMKVNLEYIPTINQILTEIVQNFYCVNNQEHSVYIGRQALEILVDMLNNNLDVSVFDIFGLRVLASRYDILKINLLQCNSFTKEKDISVELLTKLANNWKMIENMRIKHEMSAQDNIGKRIANIIERDILPMTEKLIQCLEMNI